MARALPRPPQWGEVRLALPVRAVRASPHRRLTTGSLEPLRSASAAMKRIPIPLWPTVV